VGRVHLLFRLQDSGLNALYVSRSRLSSLGDHGSSQTGLGDHDLAVLDAGVHMHHKHLVVVKVCILRMDLARHRTALEGFFDMV